MADWIGGDGSPTPSVYRQMAERELHCISPSYEAICLGVSGDADVCTRLDELPRPKRQPNLLLAAVRFVGGPVASWPEFRSFVLESWDEIAATMLARRTQTNEPRRCATLLPALAAVPQPLALLEVGASAGLCLYPDRWRYRYVPGGEIGDGPLLECAVTGPAPLPGRPPEVAWRGGLDLNPLDVRDDEDVRWLESLIWPEQTDRFVRLRAAVAIARDEPPRIERGDLLTDLVPLARRTPPDATLAVFHSAVLAYVPADERAEFSHALDEIRRERPVVWLANEAPGVVADASIDRRTDGPSRFVLTRDGHPIARTGPHGHTLDWL